LPAALAASLNQLIVERTSWGEPFELVVRDGKTGFPFFNIEGHYFEYDAGTQSFSVKEGRLLLTKEFATKLGMPSKEGTNVGQFSLTTTMRAIEVTQVVNGEVKSSVMPSLAPGTIPS